MRNQRVQDTQETQPAKVVFHPEVLSFFSEHAIVDSVYLEGNVKSYTERLYIPSFQKDDSLDVDFLREEYTYLFDEKGMLIKVDGHERNGKIDTTCTYSYVKGKEGTRIEKYWYDRKTGVLKGKMIAQYGMAEGESIDSKHTTNSEVNSGLLVQTDNNFKITTEYNSKGNLRDSVVCKCDNEGRDLEQCNYSSDGELCSMATFEYNSKGLVSRLFSYRGGTVTHKHVFDYDDNGSVEKHSTYNSNDSLCAWTIYSKDENGSDTLMAMYSPDSQEAFYKDFYKNDDRGYRIQETSSTSDFIYDYEVDTLGNITQVHTHSREEWDSDYELWGYTYNDNGEIIRVDYLFQTSSRAFPPFASEDLELIEYLEMEIEYYDSLQIDGIE